MLDVGEEGDVEERPDKEQHLLGGETQNQVRTNRNGESHCFNCGSNDHWANECPEAKEEQLAQLQMNLGAKCEEEVEDEEDEEGAMHMHVTMLQGERLSKTCGYLDNCLTITAFVNGGLLNNITIITKGVKVNCNAGAV